MRPTDIEKFISDTNAKNSMKLGSIAKECLKEQNEEHVTTAKGNFEKWIEKSPEVVRNLQKISAEKEKDGNMWGVFLYDNRGNKMNLVGGLTPQMAKDVLPDVKDEITSQVQSAQQQQPSQPQLPTGPGGQTPQIIPPDPNAAGVPPGQSNDMTLPMR
jgi:hypothetical protein